MRKLPKKPSTLYTPSIFIKTLLLKISQAGIYYFKLFLLLIFLIIIKIGQIPLTFFRSSIFSNRSLLFTPHRKRGRPRHQSWLSLKFKKTKKIVYQTFPKSIRVKIVISSIVLIFLGYAFMMMKAVVLLPSPYQLASRQQPLTTQILDRQGKLLYQVYAGQNRQLVKLEELPSFISQATVAIEDKHFFSHPGVDPWGIIRAAKANLASQGDALQGEGGSTITQQLIKNTLLTPDQTLTRKVKEALLAFWVERIYNKQQILQMYLNEAPYGGPAWGIEAAAQMYFGKPATQLSLAESAYLAGLPAAPTEYSPYGTHPEKGKERQAEVLRRMAEDKYISQDQASTALAEDLKLKPPVQEIKAPHFVMYVRALLAEKYGERAVSQGGLKVTTSLDLDIQEMAEAVVAREASQLAPLKVGNAAAMVTQAKTGQILAMVGSKDYFDPLDGNFNVTLALRQPGSSIKPVTYSAAFEKGFSPGSIVLDTPTTFPNPWGQAYSPVNYDGRFHGAVTLRTALGSSYNIPAVKMLAEVGVPEMLKTAREMGITTLNKPEDYGLSLTLGGGAVKMLEMMSVYGVLAAEGVKHTPQPILLVTDSAGNVLEDHREDEGKQVLTAEVAYLLSHILADDQARAPAFSLHSLLEIPSHTVAVKTGTSDDKRDNWAFGYTPKLVVGAWVGNNNNSPMDPKLTSGITGATPIWHDIMAALLEGEADTAFVRPSGIIETMVDGRKDLTIAGQTPKTVVGLKRIKNKDFVTYTDPFTTLIPN